MSAQTRGPSPFEPFALEGAKGENMSGLEAASGPLLATGGPRAALAPARRAEDALAAPCTKLWARARATAPDLRPQVRGKNGVRFSSCGRTPGATGRGRTNSCDTPWYLHRSCGALPKLLAAWDPSNAGLGTLVAILQLRETTCAQAHRRDEGSVGLLGMRIRSIYALNPGKDSKMCVGSMCPGSRT